MNIKDGFRAIFFLDEVRGSFPMHPDLVLENRCAFYYLDYTGSSCLSYEQAIKEFKVYRLGFEDYKDINGLLDAVVGVMSQEDNRPIYSVHPAANILLIYKWAVIRMLKHKVDDYIISSLQRRCVDLCESFYKPMILSLERRESFNCNIVAKWLDLKFDAEVPLPDFYVNVIKNLCLILHR